MIGQCVCVACGLAHNDKLVKAPECTPANGCLRHSFCRNLFPPTVSAHTPRPWTTEKELGYEQI